ncbi:MAG TPA: AI-2E family transporter [Thermoanaerobaculia bacterium]|nr:AI-2E family transporter [Thermoanaerobaculia bacterium]
MNAALNIAPTPEPEPRQRPSAPEIAAWMLTALALFLVLHLHLLAALIGGLAVYELVHIVARKLRFLGNGARDARKYLAVTLLAVLIVALLTLAIVGIIAFFRSEQGNLPALLGKMADILDGSREHLPVWLARELPANADELKNDVVAWLREHAKELQMFGAELGRTFLHALIGMIIGALVSLNETRKAAHRAPLSAALTERADLLGNAFRRIVFAQVRISALNTALTAIYLLIVLPLLGVHLPFTKTLIAITFVAGLIPVVGNLISNTVIVVVSFSYSLGVALGSLVFLVVIHKLEYFVNARIVGNEIQARAWELLLVMLAMESAFGIAGLIAGPIYYAYLKSELSARGLI